ncbi:MAG: hypothetical protein CVV47_09570 [Spirochaetae bacterium HGW-Spirochaetae-3]|jgi:hypothetical protein|nr:MAG: hypothetical protein CVV47_09570 [Spirochaetae bacterium HGW-Spirochaetae-3]
MIFTMNGTTALVTPGARTIGDALAELDERAEAMGSIIVEVAVDGRALSPDELAEASARDAAGEGTVDLVAEPAADLKSRGLETLLDLVRAASEAAASGDAESLDAARGAWGSYSRAFGGLFSAEEASFIDAFGQQLDGDAGSPGIPRIAESMSAFFGERLAELRDPSAAMMAAARVFDAIRDDLSEVPVRLQTGKDAEAMRTMVVAVELINKTVRIMPEYVRTAVTVPTEVDGTAMPEFYGALNGVLRELAQAFENKDGVLIGDLAEYEIRPRLESFYSAVRSAAGAP